jgi:hypothetical protein
MAATAPGVELPLKAGGAVTISPDELPAAPAVLVEVLTEEEPPIDAWLKVAVSFVAIFATPGNEPLRRSSSSPSVETGLHVRIAPVGPDCIVRASSGRRQTWRFVVEPACLLFPPPGHGLCVLQPTYRL